MLSPRSAWAASIQASENVGCAWIVSPSSCAVNSARIAVVAVAISSVARGPTAAAPSNRSDSASAIHLTKPVVSPAARPLPRPEKRNLPVLTARFQRGRVGFAQADGRDFGRGEDHVGDERFVPARLLADGVLRRDDPLRGGEMGELGLAGDVADGEDRRRLGPAIVVGVDEAARVGLEPGGGEVQAVGHRPAADGVEQQVGPQRFVAAAAAHAVGVGGDVGERLAGQHADAERLLHMRADLAAQIGVEQHQDVGEQLDDGDLDAEHRRHRGDLAADEAAAEHDHALRQPIEREEGAALDDPLVRGNEAGRRRGRAGGDDRPLRADRQRRRR